MIKTTANQLDLFKAALQGSGCAFKISGKGNAAQAKTDEKN